MLHGVIGLGLRRVACLAPRVCDGACQVPGTCAYERLFARQSRASDTPPNSSGGRVLSPIVLQVPWNVSTDSDRLEARIVLLGAAAEQADVLLEALEVGLAGGVGAVRVPYRLQVRGRRTQQGLRLRSPRAGRTVSIALATPVRWVQKGRVLRRFDPRSCLRQAAYRAACWAHELQGRAWSGPWPELEAEWEALRVVEERTQLVRFERYSASQRRAIPLEGLLGQIVVDRIGPNSEALLRLIAATGWGKGTSYGLGWVRLEEVASA